MNISIKQIENDLISFLKKGNPVVAKIKDIPKNNSLVELGYIDSFGIIDLVTYFEKKWQIKIDNDEITTQNFGFINKISNFIEKKILSKSELI